MIQLFLFHSPLVRVALLGAVAMVAPLKVAGAWTAAELSPLTAVVVGDASGSRADDGPRWIGASVAAPPPRSVERFGEVPDFSLIEADGRTVTRADLLGAPWLAVPFFVKCSGPCPSITTDLRTRLHDALAGTGIKIVSFSLDPILDTPAELAEYRALRSIDAERWWFLTGTDEGALHSLLADGFRVPVQRAVNGNGGEVEVGLSITHGTRMPVIDAEGRIAGWYELAASTIAKEEPDSRRHEALIGAHYGLVLARLRALAGLDPGRPPVLRAPGLRGRLLAPGSNSPLPLINAFCNGTSFVLLVLGLLAIRAGRRERHERFMKAALVASAVFLGCYLYYHGVVQREYGPTGYNGRGSARTAYFVLLVSHVVLAVVNLPMVLRTFWLAHRERWEEHRRLARLTFPLWLYVSITGVIVYLVLYPFQPAG